MAKCVFRSDRMFGTRVESGLVSLKYMGAGSTETEIENGNVVLLDGLLATDSVIKDREVFKAKTPAADSDASKIAVVAGVELFKDGLAHDLAEYTNEAGKITRGYILHSNDIFSITADGIAADAPAVGNIIELQAGTKLKAVENATSGSTVIGKIIEKSTEDGREYFAILVD